MMSRIINEANGDLGNTSECGHIKRKSHAFFIDTKRILYCPSDVLDCTLLQRLAHELPLGEAEPPLTRPPVTALLKHPRE